MRIIKRTTLDEFASTYANAKQPLGEWRKLTVAADWKNLVDTRKTFRHADQVKVASDRVVTVFNVGGNNYRLVTAIHYNSKIVYILRFLTHAEYSKNAWRNDL